MDSIKINNPEINGSVGIYSVSDNSYINILEARIAGRDCFLALRVISPNVTGNSRKVSMYIGASICDPEDAYYPDYGQQIAAGRALLKAENKPDMKIQVGGPELHDNMQIVVDAINRAVNQKISKIRFCLRQLDEETEALKRQIEKTKKSTVIQTRQALRNHIS